MLAKGKHENEWHRSLPVDNPATASSRFPSGRVQSERAELFRNISRTVARRFSCAANQHLHAVQWPPGSGSSYISFHKYLTCKCSTAASGKSKKIKILKGLQDSVLLAIHTFGNKNACFGFKICCILSPDYERNSSTYFLRLHLNSLKKASVRRHSGFPNKKPVLATPRQFREVSCQADIARRTRRGRWRDHE